MKFKNRQNNIEWAESRSAVIWQRVASVWKEKH